MGACWKKLFSKKEKKENEKNSNIEEKKPLLDDPKNEDTILNFNSGE